MRPFFDDPAPMAAEERARALARLLAAGIMRLRSSMARHVDSTEHPDAERARESSRNSLELPADTVLSVHTGYLKTSRESEP